MKIDRCMCVMQIIQRSFNFLKSYRFFGAPLNRVPLIFGRQKSFVVCGRRPKVSPLETDKLLKKFEQNF